MTGDRFHVVPSIVHTPPSDVILYVQFALNEQLIFKYHDPVVVYDLEHGLADTADTKTRSHHRRLIENSEIVVVSSQAEAESHLSDRPDLIVVGDFGDSETVGERDGDPGKSSSGTEEPAREPTLLAFLARLESLGLRTVRAPGTSRVPHYDSSIDLEPAVTSDDSRQSLIQEDLIFDIGLHKGFDSSFYLRKGFRVVGVEAREDLCEIARKNNASYVANGRLEIVPRALYDRSGSTVEFFINDNKDDWGSLYRGAAEHDGSEARRIAVSTITLEELFQRYGVPYYIKCDIEGGDSLFVDQLLASDCRPRYVSIEASSPDDVAKIRACGYNSFQIVNQLLNPRTPPPYPAREGEYVGDVFTDEMSGSFGRELPANGWIDFGTAIRRLVHWRDLREQDESLAVGWLDVHARMI
jgi:FkbM family methyltransferase